MTSFKLENDKLVNTFLNDTFLKSFSIDNPDIDNLNSIELQLNSVCDLGCKYCYYTSFGKELYPAEISKNKQILTNLEAVLIWLRDNRLTPEIDIFTGEIFAQKLGRDALDLIIAFYKATPPELRVPKVLVPTNYTFMLDKEIIKYVEGVIREFWELGIHMGLSASFDGKLLDSDNRPMKKVIVTGCEDPRGDEYYDEIFKFNTHYHFGFHPMVYSNKIELWKENFLWFQEKFEKFNIPWTDIYLLEVRNAEWSDEQIREYSDFTRFLINYAWEKCDKDIDKYFEFLNARRGFNMLAAPLGRIGRGIGCSVQSMMYIRLGDLTMSPCHRTMYKGFQTARFTTVDNRIIGIEAINPELMLTTYHFHASAQPYCEDCAIKTVCSKGCLGAQLEVMGDMFTPIPTVCGLEFAKIYAMADEYRKLGILDEVLKDRRDVEEAWKSVLRLHDDKEDK